MAALCACACSHFHEQRDPTRIVPLPSSYSRYVDAPGPDRWWKSFGDKHLNALIDEALGANLDLRSAWARLAQARALAVQAGADTWPQVNIEGSAARSRAIPPAPAETGPAWANQLRLSAASSYEVDLWGRVSAQRRAARADLDAARQGAETAAMSLAAEVADTWFAIAAQAAQLALLRAQADTSRTYVELTELRFRVGQATALDVLQQRSQQASVQSLFPPEGARLRTLNHRLAVLLGRAPCVIVDAESAVPLPDPPPLPAVGLPADLLARRPDIRAAVARLEASDFKAAAAVANRLPTLRLTGSYGYQSDELSSLLDDWIASIAAGVVGPVLDGGRRRAESRRAEAVVQEELARCGQAILVALRETEDALALETAQARQLDLLRRQLTLARDTLSESQARYRGGLLDYLPVLVALTRFQQLERETIGAHRQLLSYRVQLHRALGGEWTRDLNPHVTEGKP